MTLLYPLHRLLYPQPPKAAATETDWINKRKSEQTIDIEWKGINNSHNRNKLPSTTSSIYQSSWTWIEVKQD